MLNIDFLYFDGCPNAEEAHRRLMDAVGRLAPEAEVRKVRVEDEESAARESFAGSPSIRIRDRDLEDRVGAGTMTCRLYEGGGAPALWLIEACLLRAVAPKNILFLCVANSARSQMAEGMARHLAGEDIIVVSAGSRPGRLRPEAVTVLAELGIDISSQRSKGLDGIDLDSVEAVITLCSEEVCPWFPRPVPRLHWPLEDPAAIVGTESERLDAFRRVRDDLARRIEVLFDVRGRLLGG